MSALRLTPLQPPRSWAELPDVEMADFTIATMPARFAALGDVHAGIDAAVWSIGPLLEWAEWDEQDHGLGDAPVPARLSEAGGWAAAGTAVPDEQGDLGWRTRGELGTPNRTSSTDTAQIG
ncbi:MAG: hypothetical protein ACRDWT_02045 [Jatrophihabitantaceae bacterium]